MRLMRRVALLAAALGAVACAGDVLRPEQGGLRIAPAAVRYATGDTVRVVLENASGDTLLENFCPVRVQQRVEATWTTVHAEPPANAACPAYARTFPPGTTRERYVALPPTLGAGTYRVVFPWLGPAEGAAFSDDVRASEPFTVAPR